MYITLLLNDKEEVIAIAVIQNDEVTKVLIHQSVITGSTRFTIEGTPKYYKGPDVNIESFWKEHKKEHGYVEIPPHLVDSIGLVR